MYYVASASLRCVLEQDTLIDIITEKNADWDVIKQTKLCCAEKW